MRTALYITGDDAPAVARQLCEFHEANAIKAVESHVGGLKPDKLPVLLEQPESVEAAALIKAMKAREHGFFFLLEECFNISSQFFF